LAFLSQPLTCFAREVIEVPTLTCWLRCPSHAPPRSNFATGDAPFGTSHGSQDAFPRWIRHSMQASGQDAKAFNRRFLLFRCMCTHHHDEARRVDVVRPRAIEISRTVSHHRWDRVPKLGQPTPCCRFQALHRSVMCTTVGGFAFANPCDGPTRFDGYHVRSRAHRNGTRVRQSSST
jgi:hypothetical protein